MPSRDSRRRATVIELVAEEERRLYPVGRLDAQSTGLILLTNDGELANLLTHPRYEVPKTYRATVAGGPVRRAALQTLARGVDLDDGRTAPAKVRLVSPEVIELEIHEGRKHQRLPGVVFAVEQRPHLELGDLASGAHRPLSGEELAALRAQARR